MVLEHIWEALDPTERRSRCQRGRAIDMMPPDPRYQLKKPKYVKKASPATRKRYCKLFKVVRILRAQVSRQATRIRVLKNRLSSISAYAEGAIKTDDGSKDEETKFLNDLEDNIHSDTDSE